MFLEEKFGGRKVQILLFILSRLLEKIHLKERGFLSKQSNPPNKIYNFKSIHQFLFPFIITDPSFSLSNWMDNNKKWERQEKGIDCKHYGLYNYYHPKVEKLLFGENSGESSQFHIQNFNYIMHKAQYEIVVTEKDPESSKLTLDIPKDGITLHILEDFKIGILCMNCHNNNYDEEDILIINEKGRRIFWPFIKCDQSCSKRNEHKCSNLSTDNKPKVEGCHAYCNECANKLILKVFSDENTSISYEDNLKVIDFNNKDPKYASFLIELLDGIKFRHIIDDRMFVCCHLESDIADKLRESWPLYNDACRNNYIPKIKDQQLDVINYWYRLCFVDIGISCLSEKLKAKLLEKITYDRWMDYSSFYAYTNYSFIFLANKSVPDYLVDHFLLHYHNLLLILLFQRACLIEFSEKVNKMSELIVEQKFHPQSNAQKSKMLKIHLNNFRSDYILFINKLWFDEITPQDQGIEMYELGKSIMGLEKQKDSIRKDIDEFYQYSMQKEQREQSDTLNLISEIGAILLPINFWLAFITHFDCFYSTLIGDIGFIGFSICFASLRRFRIYTKVILIILSLIGFIHLYTVLF